MVSIIICTYNMVATLEKCITSCTKQQYKDIEILVIDDGSTDNTKGLVAKLTETDTRIRYVYQEHQGQSVAMNNGISQSKGEYIFFLDADDYIYDYCIATLMDNLETAKADISIGTALWGNKESNHCENTVKAYTSSEALKSLVSSHWTFIKWAFETSWNKIIRKSLFDGFEYPTGLGRDGVFCAHWLLAKAQTIVRTPLETYYYSYEPKERPYNLDLLTAYEDRLKFFKAEGMTELIPLVCTNYIYLYLMKHRKNKAILERARKVYEDYKEYLNGREYAFLQNILR